MGNDEGNAKEQSETDQVVAANVFAFAEMCRDAQKGLLWRGGKPFEVGAEVMAWDKEAQRWRYGAICAVSAGDVVKRPAVG